ncbi:unnamed protein product [Dracunculus medinensis]|uniref:G_PROTEIN_RECEP_F1_2 domain-containing protein n=1 Tax=Dracunculus medinensis TaxID=318479 RepID=A0A0N4UC29_DRAME|nr:unnamed protein product [Dracunculus medinensis]
MESDDRSIEVYDQIHIPLSITICLFGAISNVFNIIVLTRKNMRTPVNILLAGLSISQWLLALSYLGLITIELYRLQCYRLPWTYPFTWYRLINVNCNVIFHTVAFAHTLAIAVFRYTALKWPVAIRVHLYRTELAITATCSIWIIVPIICSPIFFTSEVAKLDFNYMNCSISVMYDLNYSNNTALLKFVFWMFGIVMKLIPSMVLAVLVIGLIRSLHSIDKRRNQLSSGRLVENNVSMKTKRIYVSTTKLTRMLVIILFLCILVEFPHGVLNLCTGIYGASFGVSVYDHLGSFMEMLTLLYSSISFILYCLMSTDYLHAFRSLFCSCTKFTVRHSSSTHLQILFRRSFNRDKSSVCINQDKFLPDHSDYQL